MSDGAGDEGRDLGLIDRILGRPETQATAQPAARVPDGTVVYAIGDVHGRLDLLESLEARIVRDAAARPAGRRAIVCLGDYVDRGYESRGVVEHLMADPPGGFERVCLKGNHEAFMLRFLEDTGIAGSWFANGGIETLMSYGVDIPPGGADPAGAESIRDDFERRLPAAHRDFLDALPLVHREGDYLFVHAGIRPGVTVAEQTPDDLMWIRGEFLNDPRDHGVLVVHGHTVEPEPQVRANRIGIDTGAYATGRLTALAMEGGERDFLST